VAVDHRLLHRMQGAVLAQVLDGEERFAVEAGHELDTGVDRAQPDVVAVEFTKHDRARPTVALGTPFLGALAAQVFTQVVENRFRRADITSLDQLAAKKEADHRVSCHLRSSLPGGALPPVCGYLVPAVIDGGPTMVRLNARVQNHMHPTARIVARLENICQHCAEIFVHKIL
jgi:hypothetical protein